VFFSNFLLQNVRCAKTYKRWLVCDPGATRDLSPSPGGRCPSLILALKTKTLGGIQSG
jgi:hypothetical protein